MIYVRPFDPTQGLVDKFAEGIALREGFASDYTRRVPSSEGGGRVPSAGGGGYGTSPSG